MESYTSQVLNLSNTSSISIPIFTPTPIDLDYSNESDTSNSSLHATLPTHDIDTEQQETQRSTHSSQHTNTSPSEIILNNWKDKLFNCSDKEELNSIIVSLSKIILTEGNKLLIPEQVLNDNQINSSNTQKKSTCRNQSRQQQKCRRYRRISAREAERIQSLYRRFPRKAVRKILGHKNEEYTGSINDLKEFTNPQDYSSSSQPYTHIHWNTLDTDEINMLSAPPTKSEIMKKLKKLKIPLQEKTKLSIYTTEKKSIIT